MIPTTSKCDALGNAPLLDVRGLKVWYGSEATPIKALDGVDLTVAQGECVGVVGESGSGKSTLARAVMRLLPNVRTTRYSGEIRFQGREILHLDEEETRKIRRGGFSMIFQDPLGFLNPTMRIGRQVAEALPPELAQAEKRRRVVNLLEEVELPDPAWAASRFPHELSGGMRQRAMIAMALASEPALLFADEPTTALDATVQFQVLQTLYRIYRERNMAIIIITHDLGVVAELCDRVYVMLQGQVVETATTDDLFERPLHSYSARLIELSKRRAAVENRT